jgi:hypothetical protein
VGKKTGQNSGQAIIEYVLLMSIIVGMSGAIMFAVRKNRDKMWKIMICDVSAACPSCKSTDSAKNFFKSSGVSCKN